ncbi:esterase/lipase family protein [Rhodopirellula sp. JC639]|uniref:esterase/lipase family protein n=1 Tax=Stieleria mannarensis TaxID=2755585 RepID=UPI0015FF1781|nr:lipase [Rhodopirellula sp. JC639]
MRYFLTLALAASLSFEIHHHSGHSAGPPTAPNSAEDSDVTDAPNFNLPLPTTPYSQIWTDHLWRDGYRVQRNALTGHWRLVDADSYRRAWGSKQQCVDALNQKCPKDAKAAAKHHVVLLHGLMRTSGSMKALDKQLAENGQPGAIRFSYASTRGSIGDHAAALRELLEDLPHGDTFSFVGHSMGNIVVRHAIGDLQSDGDPKQILPRCKSMVMLGPPNQGATIAQRLAPTKVFGWVTGKGGMELGEKWKQLEPKLAVPPFPFHIIAGDVATPVANPLVEGEGDLIVSVEEAKLDGAKSFRTVPVLHSFLMDNADVIKTTIELLKQEG